MATKYGLLFSELGTFLVVQLLALFVGWRTISDTISIYPDKEAFLLERQVNSWPMFWQMIIAFVIATVFLILIIKYLKKPVFFKGIFTLILFWGCMIAFSAFLPNSLPLIYVFVPIILSVLALLIRHFAPSVLSHNIVFFLAIAGVSAQLGVLASVGLVIGLLIVLSIYDYIAVFKTKHMVEMFKGMMQNGVVMGAIIPSSPELFTHSFDKAVQSKVKQHKHDGEPRFMMLGGGDLAFPAVFMISALAQYGWIQAVGVLLGSLAGIVGIHYLMTRGKIKALPALPPLAIGSIIGFGVSLLI